MPFNHVGKQYVRHDTTLNATRAATDRLAELRSGADGSRKLAVGAWHSNVSDVNFCERVRKGHPWLGRKTTE
jgi:hypothetical protein